MKRNTPLCKAPADQRSNIAKHTKLTARANNISAARLAVEMLMQRETETRWTVRTLREATQGPMMVGNYVASLLIDGKIRIVGTDERGHREYVWHTSSIRAKTEKRDDVAAPRQYVNSTQPTMPAEWWAKQMNWGR